MPRRARTSDAATAGRSSRTTTLCRSLTRQLAPSGVAPRPPRVMQRLRAAASACRLGLSAANAEASSFPPPWARHAHAAAAPEVKKGARRRRSERRASRLALTPRQTAQGVLRQSRTRAICCCCRRSRGPQRGASRRPRSASRAEYPPWCSTRCGHALKAAVAHPSAGAELAPRTTRLQFDHDKLLITLDSHDLLRRVRSGRGSAFAAPGFRACAHCARLRPGS